MASMGLVLNRMRQLQQLQMEERRRAAQNQTIGYRAKPAEEEDEEESQQQGRCRETNHNVIGY